MTPATTSKFTPNPEALKAITKARVKLLLDDPFLGTLALHSRLVEVTDDDYRAPASTDGSHLYYSPKQWLEWTPQQRIGVLAHEICHNALLHSFRCKNRDPEKFNQAADYAANEMLTTYYNYQLPPGVLRNPKFAELSAEAIYEELPDEHSSSNPPAPSWGQVLPAPGNAQEQQQLEQNAKNAIRGAIMAGKERGKLPGNIDRLYASLEPKIPWVETLREFLTAKLARDDYRWYPPNPHYLHEDIYVPSLQGETIGPLAICIDTSGSVTDKMLSQFLSEASAILEGCNPEYILIMYCDASINLVEQLTREDLPIKPKIVGGGGTDFRPPFEFLAAQDIEPECLLYITDMCGTFPATPPSYPVMWVRTLPLNAPFGIPIDLDID